MLLLYQKKGGDADGGKTPSTTDSHNRTTNRHNKPDNQSARQARSPTNQETPQPQAQT